MAPACIAVAYSGGRDSTALVHATLAALRGSGVRLLALHVHHGLYAEADEWLRHCAATCRRWARRGASLEFDYRRLDTRPGRGESVEAWARRERYHALGEMARLHGASAVLLAHHQRDQAETLLLQALRGAGVAGLAGMPRSIERDGVAWLRPWLATPQVEIAAYVKRHRLRHIHDGSNEDTRFARNRLRALLWPTLTAAFPQADASLATAAAWAQEASAVLADVALADLLVVSDAEGLVLIAWEGLSAARRSNALRAWIAEVSGVPAPMSLVRRVMVESAQPTASRWPVAGGELRRHRGHLRYVPTGHTAAPPSTKVSLAITRAGRYRIAGWEGVLCVTRVRAEGIALSRLGALRAVARRGGEQFQAGPGRPPRELKKQFQSVVVAAWDRSGPLLYAGDELIFVAGLGLDARAWARPGEPQVALQWQQDEAQTPAG